MNLPLSIAFTESHKVWGCHVFIFICFYAYFDFFFYFFCDLLVIQKCVVWLPYVCIFNSFFLQLTSNLTALWSEKMLGMVSIFLNLSRLDLRPPMRSILEKVLCVLEKKMKFIVLGEMSYRYQLGLTGPLYHLKFVFPC